MKKLNWAFLFLIAAFVFAVFLGQTVWSQTDEKSKEAMLQAMSERLEKIEGQIVSVLENQQIILAELKRLRYYTRRS